MEIFRHVKIDESFRVPKYQQIVNCVIDNILLGNLKDSLY